MTPEEIKTKSAEIAALYTAKANGKTLQYLTDSWFDYDDDAGPTLLSDLSCWRVKPEPRRMWTTPYSNFHTHQQDLADEWKLKGWVVTEWQEVLP